MYIYTVRRSVGGLETCVGDLWPLLGLCGWSWAVLGASVGGSGCTWAAPGAYVGDLSPLFGLYWPSWAALGAYVGGLGVPWGDLGGLRGGLGGNLGGSGGSPGGS